tara:strand:- start:21 stop:1226 length:1206 start_codon:yes stop_codon:yes gene_type:complete
MKLLNKFRNYFVFVCPFLMFIISCTSNEDTSNRIDELNTSKIEDTIDEPIDLSIKNILIYPNKFDKNSFYIDTEIFSDRFGQGEVQIALLNDGKLVAYNPIIITSDERNYFQSFLISEDIDFEKDFEISISALQGEKNIVNNRHIFKSNLKIEKPKIAIISGKLNFNSPYISNNLNTEYDHFFPDPINGEMDITDFWFTEYDIILFDNFPVKPVSDKWFNLFLKKIISEKSSIIMNSRLSQDVEVLKKFFPIFGIQFEDNIDLKNFDNYSRHTKDSFKSSFISSNEIYNVSKNLLSELNDTIDWITLDTEIQFSFYLANKDYKVNEPILIYGYSNLVNSEIKNVTANVFRDKEIIETVQFLYNPVSGYYFTQFEANDIGDYNFDIINNNKIIDTINVNIYD